MPGPETAIRNDRGGLPPIENGLPFGGGGGDDADDKRGATRSVSIAGIVLAMVASTMTFAALASTLVLRHALSQDWVSLRIPRILWPNTAALLASSVALEMARRALKAGRRNRFNVWWWTGTLLGALFLAGQTVAWVGLRRRGVFMSTNPSHGLFYLLTFTHAAHAIAGLIALLWVGVAAVRYRLGPRKRTGVVISSIFWHFLDVMWLALMALFIVWG